MYYNGYTVARANRMNRASGDLTMIEIMKWSPEIYEGACK